MHDIETAVWIILILIGVVSSIISSIRKVVRRVNASTQLAPQPQTVHEQAFTPTPAPEMPQPGIVLPPAAPPIVITKRQPKTAAVKAPEVQHDFAIPKAERGAMGSWRGMFERENLARAFVASQVFGPPKALQEQSIWSPRHSEP